MDAPCWWMLVESAHRESLQLRRCQNLWVSCGLSLIVLRKDGRLDVFARELLSLVMIIAAPCPTVFLFWWSVRLLADVFTISFTLHLRLRWRLFLVGL